SVCAAERAPSREQGDVLAAGGGGQSFAWHFDSGATDRVRKTKSGQAELRHVRKRLGAASRRGAFPQGRGRGAGARAFQGRRAGGAVGPLRRYAGELR